MIYVLCKIIYVQYAINIPYFNMAHYKFCTLLLITHIHTNIDIYTSYRNMKFSLLRGYKNFQTTVESTWTQGGKKQDRS